jgi:hypothetical protein
MFRSSPQYIVAGEIVRTSRMYAMSVSPLPREIVAKLGIMNEELGMHTKKKRRERKEPRESHKGGKARRTIVHRQ